jgi:hypothetical protein
MPIDSSAKTQWLEGSVCGLLKNYIPTPASLPSMHPVHLVVVEVGYLFSIT